MGNFNDRVLRRADAAADSTAATIRRREKLRREELTTQVNDKMAKFYDLLIKADFPTSYPGAEFDIVEDTQGQRTAVWYLTAPESDGEGGISYNQSGVVLTADGVYLYGPVGAHVITSHQQIWKALSDRYSKLQEGHDYPAGEDNFYINVLDRVNRALDHHIEQLS